MMIRLKVEFSDSSCKFTPGKAGESKIRRIFFFKKKPKNQKFRVPDLKAQLRYFITKKKTLYNHDTFTRYQLYAKFFL